MDKTLKKARRASVKRRQKNVRAWKNFAFDGGICPYCGHDGGSHLTVAIQPHFYRPATPEESGDGRVTLYTHRIGPDRVVLVRRITVARDADIVTAYCTTCANRLRTSQALCFQQTHGVGEVVGVTN
ncbi:MAG: hypothetical protein F4X20_04740 [Dehalococcoidia bacterium]|nr:hypothetical protein [Dehalococcoidia bacterium]